MKAMQAALCFLLLSGSVWGQSTVAEAPLPKQIAAARSVFLSYAGSECPPAASGYSGGTDRAFNEFNAGARSKLHYTFAETPEAADLVLTFRTSCTVYPFGGNTSILTQFFVTVLDPKTHVALWTFSESPKLVLGLQKTRDTQFDIAVTNLVDDVLRAGPAADAGTSAAAK